MSKIVNRIGEYISYKGISVRAFEISIGASNGLISRAVTKNLDITTSWVSKIIETYSEISPAWLLTGEGEMLAAGKPGLIPTDDPKQGIPLIPYGSIAGFLGGGNPALAECGCERFIIPAFPGARFLVRVKGDSMTPMYYGGDLIACRPLAPDSFFQWNHAYVIDTEQGVLVKKIQPGRNEEHLCLVSENPEYAPFEIRRKQVLSLALVVGVLRPE